MHPGLATIVGAIQSAPRAVNRGVDTPWRTPRSPHGRKKKVGIVGCHGQIRSTDVGSLIQHFCPSRAAVGGLENTALSVRCVGMPQSRDVHNSCISRVHYYAADLLGIAQPDVAPGLAAVGCLVNTISRGQVRANVRFAGTRVDNLRIGRSYGQRTDRSHVLTVKNRFPQHPGVGGLPDAAIHRAEIKRRRVAGNAGNRHGTSSTKWPDQPPLQCTKEFERHGLSARRKQADTSKKKDEKRKFEISQRAVLRLGLDVM